MGMYTEIFFRANLKPDLPEDVELAIAKILAPHDVKAEREQLPDHPLFDCWRWDLLGVGDSFYFPRHMESLDHRDLLAKTRSLALHSDFKNYDNEIDMFFDWINPHVDAEPGEFLGYSLYEDVDPGTPPFSYFKQDNS